MSVFIKYLLIGGCSAAIDLIIFLSAINFIGMHWFYAGIIGFTSATVANYFLSIRFAFNSGVRFKKKLNEFLVIFIVSIVGLIINQFALYLFIERLNLIPAISKILASASAFIWNFLIRKNYVFKESK